MSKSTTTRRNEIITLLQKRGSVKVNELCKLFPISEVTIRKDLAYLQEQGIVSRNYGVVSLQTSGNSSRYCLEKLMLMQKDEKERIADYAASLIKSNDVVFLGPGSTCCTIAQKLCSRDDVMLFTNAISFHSLLPSYNAKIIYLGGEYNNLNGSTIGSFALDLLKMINIDVLFLGANGISIESGFTSSNFSDTIMFKAIIERSKKVYYVSDHTKFGQSAAIKLSDIDDVDSIITGKELDKATVDEYIRRGINLKIV